MIAAIIKFLTSFFRSPTLDDGKAEVSAALQTLAAAQAAHDRKAASAERLIEKYIEIAGTQAKNASDAKALIGSLDDLLA